MRSTRLPLLVAVASVASVAAALSDDRAAAAPLVQTKYGPVLGTWKQGGVAAFYGVPYAAGTGGAARWKPAQPPKPWTEPWDGSKPLGREGACLQLNPFADEALGPVGKTVGTEDCLTAIIYSPELPRPSRLAGDARPAARRAATAAQAAATSRRPEPKAPVLFWIHGGAFVLGDAWEFGAYDGAALVRRFGLVVVSVQYRLGTLGFFSLPELANGDGEGPMGNQGLQDQRFALQWWQEHAEAFGGDPARVVIAGESAGGYSVCWHLAAPGSRGLFFGGISESGGCDTTLTPERAKQVSINFARAGGCAEEASGSGGQLDCLRAKDGRELLQRASEDPVSSQDAWNIWPTVDGSDAGLPDTQLRLLRAGHGSRVPAVFGHNSDEFQVGCLPGQTLDKCDAVAVLSAGRPVNSTLTRQTLESFAQALGLQRLGHLTDAQWAKVLRRYPLGDVGGSEAARMSAIFMDAGWEGPRGEGGSVTIGQCNTLRAVRAAAAAGAPVYMYHYDYHTHALGTSRKVVQHGDEIAFVFENRTVLEHSKGAREVSLMLGAYWANFVARSNPNAMADSRATRLAHWPEFGASGGKLLRITGPATRAEQPARRDFCDFWQDLLVPQSSGRTDRAGARPASTPGAISEAEARAVPAPAASPRAVPAGGLLLVGAGCALAALGPLSRAQRGHGAGAARDGYRAMAEAGGSLAA